MRVCPVGGCPEWQPCPTHKRPTASQRGYTSKGHRRFREQVLARDPFCVCTEASHGHGTPCLAEANVADHYPDSRKQLIAQGDNPDDPDRGRGLCTPCHNRETARWQPGGIRLTD